MARTVTFTATNFDWFFLLWKLAFVKWFLIGCCCCCCYSYNLFSLFVLNNFPLRLRQAIRNEFNFHNYNSIDFQLIADDGSRNSNNNKWESKIVHLFAGWPAGQVFRSFQLLLLLFSTHFWFSICNFAGITYYGQYLHRKYNHFSNSSSL